MSRARDVADTQDNIGGAVAPFVAGKNKIINGDFGVWQRGTSFSNPSSGTFTADRWRNYYDGTVGTKTISQQTFTPGTAPVVGYEGTYFLRYNQSVASTGGTYCDIRQTIEDVRIFANQTITISFWAKAAATTSLVVIGDQDFGSGGSARVYNAINSSTFTVTTSWQRFSFSASVASIAGKTIGTSSFFELVFRVYTSSTFTLDIWGVQMEAGSVATPFTTATGTIQGELAACQRYYMRFAGGQTFSRYVTGYSSNTNTAFFNFPLPVSMRIGPTAVDYSTLILDNGFGTSAAVTTVVLTANCQSPTTGSISLNVASGLTADRNYQIENNNSTAGYIGFSAEL